MSVVEKLLERADLDVDDRDSNELTPLQVKRSKHKNGVGCFCSCVFPIALHCSSACHFFSCFFLAVLVDNSSVSRCTQFQEERKFADGLTHSAE